MFDKYIDNAVVAYESGVGFDKFCTNAENIELSEDTGVALDDMWEIAIYIIDVLKEAWTSDNADNKGEEHRPSLLERLFR